jgi:hypothetical protein
MMSKDFGVEVEQDHSRRGVFSSDPGTASAERSALTKLGVVAFSSTGDPEMGDYDDEPTVIFRNGRFPPAFD